MISSEVLTVDTRISRTSSAIVAEIEGQMVALDVKKGVCYGLNQVATRIWQLIETPDSARAVAAVLITEFEIDRETCEQQTLDLFRDLLAADLVVAEALVQA